nr:hypothetical protein [Tanacetum cinerariifolium]
MNNKKHIVNLKHFREMLHICLRILNQTFDELLFEEEILAFLRYLGHSREIKKITDVNINKLHQPWRSFAAVINKCINFAYLLWEDFVYQVEYKDAKKSNEMYYPRDDQMFTMIKIVSRHQNTQYFGSMLPVELTNEDIRNSAKSSDEDDDNDVDDQSDAAADDDDQKDEDDNDDESHGINVGGDEGPDAEDDDEELYKDININLEGQDVQITDVHTTQVLEDTQVTLTPVNPDGQQQSSSVSSQFLMSMFNPSPDTGIDSLFENRVNVPVMTTVEPL